MGAASTRRRLAAGDLLRDPKRYEFCELWDGSLVVREPSNLWPEGVAGVFVEALRRHVAPRRRGARPLGLVTTSQGAFHVARDPDWVLVPDVAFIADERLKYVPVRGYAPLAPDLAVEVRSPSDSWESVLAKAAVWLGHGVRLVIAVDPLRRVAVEWRSGAAPVERRGRQSLSGAPVLPRFRLSVAKLFAELPGRFGAAGEGEEGPGG
jgi:Uma2 family endonuclease